jgi:ABC-type branched-subunit amino acid transport system substrate-binding protein
VTRRVPAVALAAALLATTAACGARWTEQERADVYASASSRGRTTGTAVVSDDPGAVAIGGAPTGAGGEGGAGVVADVGGTGTSGPATVPGARPCAAASRATGVTPTQITVGSISSLSGPVPGLGASSAAASRAYVAYLNSIGGVCGRKVVLKEADDGLEGSRYRAIVTDMASQVLGIAGGFSNADIGGLDVIRRTALPVVNVPSNDDGTALPTLFDLNPPYEGPDVLLGKYRYLYEHGVRTATQVYLAVAQSRAEAQRQARLMAAAGIRVTEVQELPLTTLSFEAPARKVANSGADYLFFIADERGNAAMARAVRDTGYRLKSEEYFTFAYGAGFIDQAGVDGAEGAVTWLRSLPNEDASINPEIRRFVEWMDRVAPGDDKDPFAVDSWASAKAFFDALQALPGPISREALVAQLRAIDVYDAGGMFGPIRFGAERNRGCMVGMQVRDGRWQRLSPSTGFTC